VLAGVVPIGFRLQSGKRAAPGSGPIRLHVMFGFVVSLLAFGHTLLVIPALGSPAATGGGVFALLPGAAAFLFLLAHAGLGLQLRNEKLKDRAQKRRAHATTAISIVVAVALHAAALLRAAR
jgi:cytochrome b561